MIQECVIRRLGLAAKLLWLLASEPATIKTGPHTTIRALKVFAWASWTQATSIKQWGLGNVLTVKIGAWLGTPEM